jgi:hypothetical protein
MTLNLFSALANLFGGLPNRATKRSDLMTWAKTEYARDWEFAYQYMLDNRGKAPSHRHTQGITHD